MAPMPPPHNMSDADYQTIEAAVTETVRGRWFLGEFARRNRTAEMKLLLDAMTRLEGMIGAGMQPAALPPVDPSIRLLMQRIKEIAARLEGLSTEMRDAGLEARFPEALDAEARAVSGMLRAPAPPLPSTTSASLPAPRAEPPPERSRAIPPPAEAPTRRPSSLKEAGAVGDPRLAALAALDDLPLAKKLALFS